MKIFRLLPLSIHNLYLYKFCFERHIRLNSYRTRYKVVQGTNCTRFNFYNKVWKYTNNNDDIEIRVKQTKKKNNATITIIIAIISLMQIIMILTTKLTATVII